MSFIIDGIGKAFALLAHMDAEVLSILRLSLWVSISAVAIAACVGVPLGSIIAVRDVRFKKWIIALVNTSMGLPPVVVGLVATLLLSRNGPLGPLGWLYTPSGMILAQVVIAVPIVTGLSISAVQSVDKRMFDQILSMGATLPQALWVLMREIKVSIVAAIIAGFGSVISEVGAVMMVGGNIKGETRVLTTAVVLETRMGNFDMAIALGLILLIMSFIINTALTFIQQKAR